jgi:hypothetical protein
MDPDALFHDFDPRCVMLIEHFTAEIPVADLSRPFWLGQGINIGKCPGGPVM